MRLFVNKFGDQHFRCDRLRERGGYEHGKRLGGSATLRMTRLATGCRATWRGVAEDRPHDAGPALATTRHGLEVADEDQVAAQRPSRPSAWLKCAGWVCERN